MLTTAVPELTIPAALPVILALLAISCALVSLIRRAQQTKKPHSVYIMVREPDHAVKIGVTNDVPARLSAGRTWIPEGLDSWDVFQFPNRQTAFAVEAAVHRALKRSRITKRGRRSGSEWFRVSRRRARKAVQQAIAEENVPAKEQWWLKWRWNLRYLRYRSRPKVIAVVACLLVASRLWPDSATHLISMLGG